MDEFEFDAKKSAANLEKHGIDFQLARQLWDDPNFLEVQAKSEDENRFLVIGLISQKHGSAVVTYRGKRIRLISVSRSRKKKVELYES